MQDKLTSIICPNCEEPIAFKAKFLDDEEAVSFCLNPDCFYVFYPATGKPLPQEEYQVHQRYRDRTLGIRPDRSWIDEVRPQNIKVPCPECGNYFHQTKRLDRVAKFKCPGCKHAFELDPKQCVVVPPRGPVTKGISPDRPQPRAKKELKYVEMDCPSCEKAVRFVEDLLHIPNHAVLCSGCYTLFDPQTKKVLHQDKA